MRQANALSVEYNTQDRFWLSFLLSVILHIAIVAILWFVNEQLKKPKLHKVELDNILFLKRGDSFDKNDDTPGTPPPSIASPESAPPTPPSASPNMQEHNFKEQRQSKRVPLPNEKQESKKTYQSLNQPNKPPAQSSKGRDRITSRAISELYGREWGDLGSVEKDFVTNNLREIARITQSYLEYPQAAGYLGQQGENAVEFYLLPNGDIQGLKLLRSSKFKLLDENSTKTIRIAFKDYPRPQKPTLIRFHITYRLH
ncbi:energy transducer TonB [Helicobacter sp. T3_23-1059]